MSTATATRTRLVERAAASAGRVDVENAVLRNVRVLGYTSKNRRRYTKSAVSKAASKYEGRQVFYDHNGDNERSVGDLAGHLRNIHVGDDGLRGDLALLKSDPRSARILELAVSAPHLVGLSHVADGDVEDDATGQVVTRIDTVFSVDLVTRPASTNGLFESDDAEVQRQAEKLSQAADDALADPAEFKASLIRQGEVTLIERLKATLDAICEKAHENDLASTLDQLERAVRLAREVVDDPSTTIVDDQRGGSVVEGFRPKRPKGTPAGRRQRERLLGRTGKADPDHLVKTLESRRTADATPEPHSDADYLLKRLASRRR